ncbi:hypothetical protein [Stutzerimonas degradans]|uniref:hypothetical protein n=1 Tax=Stutzerimonas degradans TaxID=2968968 RepID=UPI0015E153C6|nr:hypothetical protein [Stutzerimonas degradans]MCQ4273892.1 hypothetical protein [Stutzerimonas degradans]QPT21033.1 hypothetical protein I6G33_15360 [Stutzerimonas degradans]
MEMLGGRLARGFLASQKKSAGLSIAERAERPGDEQPFNPTTGDQHERAKAP